MPGMKGSILDAGKRSRKNRIGDARNKHADCWPAAAGTPAGPIAKLRRRPAHATHHLVTDRTGAIHDPAGGRNRTAGTKGDLLERRHDINHLRLRFSAQTVRAPKNGDLYQIDDGYLTPDRRSRDIDALDLCGSAERIFALWFVRLGRDKGGKKPLTRNGSYLASFGGKV
jgi:hypothetical protein